jgi:ribosome biogenesis GTPase A
LASDNAQAKLATDYEVIRRREYELITHLLGVLPKIDNLGDEQVAQVRDALFHADHPYLMVFVGPFSSGKSSIINALLGEYDLMPVGPVPTTDRISILRWGDQPGRLRSSEADTVFHPSPLLRKVSFVDTPGLESVFKQHEETTRKFLHRSDVVLLVMLATQAMTARNLEYLQMLEDVGKKVIIVISQSDLLTAEEAETVRQYVLDQSQTRLGRKPDIWMVSAKMAMTARSGAELDVEMWKASGLNQIEDYVNDQLSDVARLRQKLQTPLQITQNAHQVALTAVRANQSALDQYQRISENLDGQLAAQKREQEKIVRDINAEVSDKFGEAAMRGSEALRDIFQLGRALPSLGGGLTELIGLAGLLRRAQGTSRTRTAFEQHKAFEPIAELPGVVDKLGPRLEGRDVQDVDDLVKYAGREIGALPASIREKVIGSVQPPVKYDREALQMIRDDLVTVEEEARKVEVERLDQTVRNTLVVLATYEILLIVFGIAAINILGGQPPETLLIVVAILIGLGVLGLVFLPLRGRLLETAYTNRMLALQARYIEAISKAADKQIAYGMQLRRDVVAPLTRLIDAQTQTQTEQINQLQAAQQEMVAIEADLTSLGKRRLLG